jgi:phage tail-like protein
MAVDRNTYPPVGFYFDVVFRGISGVAATGVDTQFQEVSGFNQELGVEELVEGGENRFSHRLPNRGKFANLVLKRGVMVNSQLVTWLQDAIDNFIFNPATVEVTLLNEEGKPLVKWEFLKAWPVKWSTSDLKSTENAIVVETLELSYQYFTKSYVT